MVERHRPSHVRTIGRTAAQLPVRRLGQGATVALLGISAAFGGLDTADLELATLTPGERHVGPQLATTVDRVVLVDDLAPAVTPAEGNHLLVVVAEVENLDTAPVVAFSDALVLDGVAGLDEDAGPATMLVRDGHTLPTLQPQLVERVAFVWEVAAETAPDAVDVVVRAKSFVRSSEFIAGDHWVDPEPVARLTVEVEDERA